MVLAPMHTLNALHLASLCFLFGDYCVSRRASTHLVACKHVYGRDTTRMRRPTGTVSIQSNWEASYIPKLRARQTSEAERMPKRFHIKAASKDLHSLLPKYQEQSEITLCKIAQHLHSFVHSFYSFPFMMTSAVCGERIRRRAIRCTSFGVRCCSTSPLVSMSSEW